MPTRNAYIATTGVIAIAFGFQIASLFDPKWVQYKSPRPYYTETNYGLFQKCSTLTEDCRRFPSKEWDDCSHDKGSGRWVNLCTEWRIAAGVEIAAAIVGLWILAALGMVLYTGQRWHAQGWKHVLGLVGIFAGLQVVSMGLIAHVVKTSAMFYHHQYGPSFIFSNVSWTVAALTAFGVMGYAKYGNQGRIELP
ncbi:hypothetical protein B0O80DRAFT_458864 [Mortierella sp. GBAus27b]|nr:hypothetical protein B0O80DRAFT_458864 [Mortierella sp. GBAus27b]